MKLNSIISDESISRKQFLAGTAGIIATAAVTGKLSAQEHHHHHTPAKFAGVIEAAQSCVTKGEVCSNHCIELIKKNDTTIINCLETVQEMLVMCRGLATLAAAESRVLAKYARLCIEVCEACEKECKRHADKHTECADCAKSCAECIRACKGI
jgi:Cys-rich four helix bundle protein (predicted Tat secretion target)